MPDKQLRVLHLSDTHLMGNPAMELLGVKTCESFEVILAMLEDEIRQAHVDFIIHSGDMSQDDTLESYIYFSEKVKRLGVPIYYVPGNHDNPAVMKQLFPVNNIHEEKHIIHPNWQVVMLNSQKRHAVEGYLDHVQLGFLDESLGKYPDMHAIIVFHHQPLPVGAQWLDNLGLTNASELWGVLQKHSNVNTVLFGHVHQEFTGKVHGIRCMSVPSTCIQFMRQQDHFGLEHIPPGYRWLDLYADGSIQTGVKRASQYVGVFDKDAKGY
jgi:Icc protein